MYEEDYIDFMGHKYDRTRSKFNGNPLFGEGEISVQQCAKMFGKDTPQIYYLVLRGKISHSRRGKAIILNYEECMEYFTKNERNQMELIND